MAITSQPQPIFIIDLLSEVDTGWPDGSLVYVKEDRSLRIIDSTAVESLSASDHVLVETLSDFPDPVGDVITLEDNKAYQISGNVDIGANRIVCGVANIITGIDRTNDRITSSTSGNLFTCDSSSIVKTIFTIQNISITAPSATFINFTSTSANQSLVIISCTISGVATLGTLHNPSSIIFRNSLFSGATVGGFSCSSTATGAQFVFRDCVSLNNAGTTFALGTAVYQSIIFGGNRVTTNASQTFLSGTTGGANVTVAGKITGNIFSGAGTQVSTLTNTDTNWFWDSNAGITDTPVAGTFDALTDVDDLPGGTTAFLRGDGTFAVPAGGAGASATTVEANLGATWATEGRFTITDAAITGTSKVLCWQAPGPYTGKGTRADEAAMQPVQVVAVEPATGSATVYWQTPPIVVMSRVQNNVSKLSAAGATFDRLHNQRWPDVFEPKRIGKVKGNVKFSYMVLS